MKTSHKSNELLIDLAQHIASDLKALLKLNAYQAEEIGSHIAKRMSAHWGGQNIYFPMNLSNKISQRDTQIYKEFNGTNHSELARKYGVSLQWIYKIIKSRKNKNKHLDDTYR